jgi:hypothetical protein
MAAITKLKGAVEDSPNPDSRIIPTVIEFYAGLPPKTAALVHAISPLLRKSAEESLDEINIDDEGVTSLLLAVREMLALLVGLTDKVDALETQVARGFAAAPAIGASNSAAAGGDVVKQEEARQLGDLLAKFWAEARPSLFLNPLTHFSNAEGWEFVKSHSAQILSMQPELLRRIEACTLTGDRGAFYKNILVYNNSKIEVAFKRRSEAMVASFFEVVLNLAGSNDDRLAALPHCHEVRDMLLMSTGSGSSASSEAEKAAAEKKLLRILYKVGLSSLLKQKCTAHLVVSTAATTSCRAFDVNRHLDFADFEEETEETRTLLEWKATADAAGLTTEFLAAILFCGLCLYGVLSKTATGMKSNARRPLS